MSGIAGILNIDGRPVDGAHLQGMSSAMVHRGSDGDGLWLRGPVGLAHRILRTTPESLNESQPASLDGGDYVITCDGKLDNRDELAGKLAIRPQEARTLSDAEFILRAYAKWGVESASHLVGDFAFAIWDARRQELYCARDPIGLRMFNYHFDGKRFVFGSEIKQLLAVPGIPRQVNERKVALWLSGGLGDAEQTFYEGINRLPGGCYLTVSRNGVTSRPYWKPDPSDQIILGSQEQYVEKFRELFARSVQSKMRGVGPTGVWLSGGLDSTSIFCMAEETASESNGDLSRPRYLSAVFPGSRAMDESEYIDAVVGKYESKGFKLPASEMWSLKQGAGIGRAKDEPLTSPTEPWESALAEHAHAQGIKVILTGEGGDQLLHAWDGYLIDTLRAGNLGEFLSQFRRISRPARRQVLQGYLGSFLPQRVSRWKAGKWGISIHPWINPGFEKKVDLKEQLLQDVHAPRFKSRYFNGLDELVEARGRHMAYPYIDMVGAEYGIEFRHPFWDRRLAEFLIRTPARYKYSNGHTKLLLREAMRGVLPEKVRRRRSKPNFGPLFDRGIAVEEKARIEGLLEDPLIGRLGYVNVPKLREAIEGYDTAPGTQRFGIFSAIILEEWLQDSLASNGGEGMDEKVSCPPVMDRLGKGVNA